MRRSPRFLSESAGIETLRPRSGALAAVVVATNRRFAVRPEEIELLAEVAGAHRPTLHRPREVGVPGHELGVRDRDGGDLAVQPGLDRDVARRLPVGVAGRRAEEDVHGAVRRRNVSRTDRRVGGRAVDVRRQAIDRPDHGGAAPDRTDPLDPDFGVVLRRILHDHAVRDILVAIRAAARHGHGEKLTRHAGGVGEGGGYEGEDEEHGISPGTVGVERVPGRYLQLVL